MRARCVVAALLAASACTHHTPEAPFLAVCPQIPVPEWAADRLGAACAWTPQLKAITVYEGTLTIDSDASLWTEFPGFLPGPIRDRLAAGLPIVYFERGGGRWVFLASPGGYEPRLGELADFARVASQSRELLPSHGGPIGSLTSDVAHESIPARESLFPWVYAEAVRSMESPFDRVDWNASVPTGPEWMAQHQILRDVPGYRDSLDGLLALNDAPLQSEYWPDAIDALLTRGDMEDALKIFRRYRPVGYCSMDGRPEDSVYAYAKFCARTGNMSCLVPLQRDLMTDGVARAVWSSWLQTSRGTAIELLDHADIDVANYLVGLSVRFSTSPGGSIVPEWRLAMAISESSHRSEVVSRLQQLLAIDSIDPMNQMRMASILEYVSCIDGDPPRSLSEGVELDPLTAFRLDTVRGLCGELRL